MTKVSKRVVAVAAAIRLNPQLLVAYWHWDRMEAGELTDPFPMLTGKQAMQVVKILHVVQRFENNGLMRHSFRFGYSYRMVLKSSKRSGPPGGLWADVSFATPRRNKNGNTLGRPFQAHTAVLGALAAYYHKLNKINV